MKFYNKRSDCIVIDDSRVLNEIFYDIYKMQRQHLQDNYVFVLQEDKIMQGFDEDTILSMKVDIVPNRRKKRMPYNFANFEELYECLKQHAALPYEGEDLV